MYFHSRLPERHRDAETAATVSKIANIFVVITSLVFGLLITSSKSTFEAIDRNQHNYGTDLILLDRVLRDYGADANDARNRLITYAEEALAHPARVDEIEHTKQDRSGRALDAVGTALNAIRPADLFHQSLLSDARSHYHDVVHLRWVIVEQSEGYLPMPILGMLLAWLTLIFASYGYRAPQNAVVVSMLLISAALIAASVYLVLDMDVPFKGPIQISDQPIRRALNEMHTP
jgi:hypothetical protein